VEEHVSAWQKGCKDMAQIKNLPRKLQGEFLKAQSLGIVFQLRENSLKTDFSEHLTGLGLAKGYGLSK